MSTQRQLLFLSQTLPYPPDGGVKIRTYNILRLLARHFDVTALCFYRRAVDPEIEAARVALAPLARVEVFPIPQEHSRLRLGVDHLRSLFGNQVYTVYAYESAAYRRRLAAHLAATRFDLVHADSLDLSPYFPLLQGLPIVCVHHDAQSVLLRRRAQHERSRLRRTYVSHQAGLMAAEERIWCSKVALNVTVSEVDREELQRQAPQGRFTVVPNGVDVHHFRPEPGENSGVVFVGGAGWYPNADAMRHFCSDMLPALRTRCRAVSIQWVGRASDEVRRHFETAFGIDVTGYVDDVRPYVRDASCVIVPLRIGGGTRIKILDAWAMGKAVVSTTVGCEGLDARDGENILIRDDPEEFAAAVADVLEDMELRRRLETAARTTAERTYDWDVIEKRMVADYMSLLGGRGAVDSSGVIPFGGIPARDPSGTAPQEAPPAPSA